MKVAICVFALLAALVSANSLCEVNGHNGVCVGQTSPCEGHKMAHEGCGAESTCCVTNFGGCVVKNTTGVCRIASQCMGVSVASSECDADYDVECCLHEEENSMAPQAEWTRADCEKVAAAWMAHKVEYSWSPRAKQFITSGPGPYRTDCSGFVSACWNIGPPGAVTQSFPHVAIKESELVRGDALLQPSDHVALFWGWSADHRPIVIEECGHFAVCCGGQHTCPGKCEQGGTCNEYCLGCPIMQNTWAGLNGFQPIRRHGW